MYHNPVMLLEWLNAIMLLLGLFVSIAQLLLLPTLRSHCSGLIVQLCFASDFTLTCLFISLYVFHCVNLIPQLSNTDAFLAFYLYPFTFCPCHKKLANCINFWVPYLTKGRWDGLCAQLIQVVMLISACCNGSRPLNLPVIWNDVLLNKENGTTHITYKANSPLLLPACGSVPCHFPYLCLCLSSLLQLHSTLEAFVAM